MRKAIIALVVIIIVIQFFGIDKTNPTADMSKDFIEIYNPPTTIAEMIKSSCYDCHSYHSKYPWYANVAPVSWIVKNHINDGRRHLNFSIWTDYKEAKKEHKIQECIDEIKSEEMPLKPYLLLHDEAKLTEAQKNELVNWLKSLIK